MMNDLTIEKLYELKLPGMAAELQRQLATPGASDLPFEQRVRCLVDHEITIRDDRRMQSNLKRAAFPVKAAVEEVNYRASRGLDKSKFISLASLDWIRHRDHVTITGPTGTGKTWLACALGFQACREGLSCHFIRATALVESLAIARATSSLMSRLQQLRKFDLIVVDDFGIEPFSAKAENDLLEFIVDRIDSKSLLITSQIPMKNWHELFSNKTVADAFMDRVVHRPYKIVLAGESLRKGTHGSDSKRTSRRNAGE